MSPMQPVFTPGAGQYPSPLSQGNAGQSGGFPSSGSNVPPGSWNFGHSAPSMQQQSFGNGSLSAALLEHLKLGAAPLPSPKVNSAFEVLGRTPTQVQAASSQDNNTVVLKALTAALTGDRKPLPSWPGNPESLRSWMCQLSLWELDNNTPKERWGLKIMQSFPEGSAPRRLCEAIDIGVLSSPQGYSAVLSAIVQKYGPYIEAVAPATTENFSYAGERSKQDTFATYIAAKEIALQELESNIGERLPSKIAGRILLKHAGLSDSQRESLAIKYQAMMTFEQAAAALRPLDRPEALVTKVARTFVTGASSQDVVDEEWHDDLEEEELQPDEEDGAGPESDGEGNLTYMLFDPDQEYAEEEANYIWAYNSAYKDVRRELQSRRKGRNFFRPSKGKGGVMKKGKTKGKRPSKHRDRGGGSGFGRGQGGQLRGTPEDLLAKTRCFSCGELGHMSKECPNNDRSNTFFICRGALTEQTRIYMQSNVACHIGRSIEQSVGCDIGCSIEQSVGCDIGCSIEQSVGCDIGCSIEQSVGCDIGRSIEQSVGDDIGCVEQHVEQQNSALVAKHGRVDYIGRVVESCPDTATGAKDFGAQRESAQAPSQRSIQVYAGVKTEASEAIVDTAAEEGVIGSSAMARLRMALARFGLQPAPAKGTTVNCAGIGGNAKIAGIYDVPLGIAKNNALLRVTEIQDEGSYLRLLSFCQFLSLSW